MAIEIKINDSLDPKARYITYAPSRLPDPADACGGGADRHALEQRGGGRRRGGGVLRQSDGRRAIRPRRSTLTLPAAGTWVNFGLAGKPGKPSVDDLDCLLVATRQRDERDGAADGARPEERQQAEDRASAIDFCWPWPSSTLRAAPTPSAYQTLRNMHVSAANRRGTPGTSLPAVAPEHICSTSSVSSRRSIRPCRCTTGASTSPRRRCSPVRSWAKRGGRPRPPHSSSSIRQIRSSRGSPTPCPASFVRQASTR